MKTKSVLFVGIIGLIFLIVAVSGCTGQSTGTSKVIWDQNLSESTTNPVIDKYVALPNGTQSVTIEYTNVTGETNGYFQFETYNVVAQGGQSIVNYASNIVDSKSIDANSTPLSGNLTLDVNGAKSVGIRDSLGKGNVKVIITQ